MFRFSKVLFRAVKQKAPVIITFLILVFYTLKLLKYSLSASPPGVEPPTENRANNAFQEPVRGEDNIFFVETFCFAQPAADWHLSPRQACAVESAARWNPAHKVYLLHTCQMDLRTLPQHARELLLFDNVWFWKLDAKRFVQGTIVEEWWTKRGGVTLSNFPVVHASDVFRLLVLWKYGGTYMDLDVVVLKSLSVLKSNFIGAESRLYLANGIMNFKADGFGHGLAEECLVELMRTFNGDTWSFNGPLLVTRLFSKRCNATETQLMTAEACQGFNVLPPSTFYPIPWAFWKLYFLERDPTSGFPLSLVRDSLVAHTWNKYSAELPVDIGSHQTYALLAADHCPRAYHHSEAMPVF